MSAAEREALADDLVDAIIARHPDRTGDVLGILEELQRRHPLRYLPRQTYARVARQLGIAPAQIVSVITFYAFFNSAPQGRHTITVCRGTACHTRGSRPLLEMLKARTGVGQGDAASGSAVACTTADCRLTIRTVACFGQCAQAPVVAVDDEIHGRVSDLKLRALLAAIDGGAAGGGRA